MDCNMDEAIRAREMAATKLNHNDFAAARKLALKAQQLYPNLDNINHLLSVCDVHCASQQKINGNEMDWYGILQIAQTADDSLIKKHYRKLALLLHPDKNKFPGAEAAFKLIGDAQRLLSDPLKRQLHDMKRTTYVRPKVRTQCQQTKNNDDKRRSADAHKSHFGPQYANVNGRQQPQPPVQSTFKAFSKFVTVCSHCTTMSQVSSLYMYHTVLCLSCKRTYIASEAPPEKLSKETNDREASFVEEDALTQGRCNTSMKFEENAHPENCNTNGSTKADCSKGDTRNNIDTKSKKINNKRKRPKLEEVREDTDSDSSSGSDECEMHVADGKLRKDSTNGSDGELNRRRSTRQKQKISYNESLSDDDDELLSHNDIDGSVSKSENQDAKVRNVENGPDHKDLEPHFLSTGCSKTQNVKKKGPQAVDHRDLKSLLANVKPPAESTDDVASFRSSKENCSTAGTQGNFSVNQFEESKPSDLNSEPLKTPDPEFFNFETERPLNKFEVGQMWAVYSDDGLPKYYVQIQGIRRSPNFELVTRWLIPSREQGMYKWRDRKMPYGCGIFRLSTARPKDFSPDTFSHRLGPPMTGKKGEFAIFPQKGEVWALYKDWNLRMNFLDIEDFEYEVAEVLNMDDQTVEVLPLHHVSGRVSVFRGQEGGITVSIPKEELLRFSHQIPSFRLTDELNGTLRGYWELDPAAVPPALLCSS